MDVLKRHRYYEGTAKTRAFILEFWKLLEIGSHDTNALILMQWKTKTIILANDIINDINHKNSVKLNSSLVM